MANPFTFSVTLKEELCCKIGSQPQKNPLWFNFLFIYLLLVVLGLRCCVQAFSSCGKPGLFFCAVGRLLIVVVSLAAKL